MGEAGAEEVDGMVSVRALAAFKLTGGTILEVETRDEAFRLGGGCCSSFSSSSSSSAFKVSCRA